MYHLLYLTIYVFKCIFNPAPVSDLLCKEICSRPVTAEGEGRVPTLLQTTWGLGHHGPGNMEDKFNFTVIWQWTVTVKKYQDVTISVPDVTDHVMIVFVNLA